MRAGPRRRLLLRGGNAFFVGAEFAIISARRSHFEPLAREGDRRAKTVLWGDGMERLPHARVRPAGHHGVLDEPGRRRRGPRSPTSSRRRCTALGVSERLTHPIAFVVALAIVVYLHVVLGEMVPKNLAVAGPDRGGPALRPAAGLGRARRCARSSLR